MPKTRCCLINPSNGALHTLDVVGELNVGIMRIQLISAYNLPINGQLSVYKAEHNGRQLTLLHAVYESIPRGGSPLEVTEMIDPVRDQ
ncbi:hypothetical protein GN244_ATG13470 [Phytophthora infestans]|uniref:Uncharacterized protein n=1 Tax=Phytophthora infestans TaxID=4787 RepID=A0A833VYT6_PHYIN|nr:hypothetical protein GN244_ATG13470 [Phytophthora infestans]